MTELTQAQNSRKIQESLLFEAGNFVCVNEGERVKDGRIKEHFIK